MRTGVMLLRRADPVESTTRTRPLCRIVAVSWGPLDQYGNSPPSRSGLFETRLRRINFGRQHRPGAAKCRSLRTRGSIGCGSAASPATPAAPRSAGPRSRPVGRVALHQGRVTRSDGPRAHRRMALVPPVRTRRGVDSLVSGLRRDNETRPQGTPSARRSRTSPRPNSTESDQRLRTQPRTRRERALSTATRPTPDEQRSQPMQGLPRPESQSSIQSPMLEARRARRRRAITNAVVGFLISLAASLVVLALQIVWGL